MSDESRSGLELNKVMWQEVEINKTEYDGVATALIAGNIVHDRDLSLVRVETEQRDLEENTTVVIVRGPRGMNHGTFDVQLFDAVHDGGKLSLVERSFGGQTFDYKEVETQAKADRESTGTSPYRETIEIYIKDTSESADKNLRIE